MRPKGCKIETFDLPVIITEKIRLEQVFSNLISNAVKSDEKLKNIKVFVMTTSGEEADRRATEQLGISGYLIKPLNFNNNSKRADSMDGFVQFHLRKILAAKQL